mgnify:CR=1 FL=1
MAVDMTVYWQRDKVKLIREDAHCNRQLIPLNLNDADIIVSPYYYLQQNDVVYVTPNKTKAKNAGISNSTTIWFSVVGTLVSLVSLIVTIPNKQNYERRFIRRLILRRKRRKD